MKSILNYLGRLSLQKQILWCYLIWYLTMVILHFDAAIHIWLTSIGVSIVIGIALILSISNGSDTRHDFWTRARLFMMPFCVSSFSALVKDQGFILILSPRWQEDVLALLMGAIFLIITYFIKRKRLLQRIQETA